MAQDNESWIIDAGDAVIEKRADDGDGALTPIDKLVYCLWVADYGMRNAGDLVTAADVYAPFQEEAAQLAKDLSLTITRDAFALSREELQRRYFELFDPICEEIKAAR